MNFRKKLATLATVLTVAVSGVASTISSVPVTAADTNNDDWLHAVGSRLYDSQGNQVWLTGVNWFGMNCTENFPHGLWSADVDELLSSVADRGINIIRFPVSTELLLSWMNGTPYEPVGLNAANGKDYSFNPDFCDADGSTMDSMGIFDVIIQKCKKYGIKALVDVHSPASHNSGHNYNLWYYDANCPDADNMAVGFYSKEQITTEDWITSLAWLAEKYKNDDTIIAYDLKNEPHGKGQDGSVSAKWDDSTDPNNWAYAATQCANAVLDANPNALILIEGVEQSLKSDSFTWGQPDSLTNSPYIPGWWGGNLRGVKENPVDLGSEERNSKIVYSPHDYGPSVYAQTWFQKDFTTQTLLDDYWYDTWAYVNDQDIAPLLIGEWGGHMDGAENQKWMTLLRDYMIDNHINHTFWCLNPNSGDTGGLLDHSFKTWDEEKYGLFEPSLWQTTTSGKYIGLDHSQPLGLNGTGITVTDYYVNYATSEGSNLDSDGSVKPQDPVTPPSDTPTTEPTVSPTTDFISGDVNSDKKINVFDNVALKRILMGDIETVIQSSPADVTGDGSIAIDDLVLLNKFLIGEDVVLKKFE